MNHPAGSSDSAPAQLELERLQNKVSITTLPATNGGDSPPPPCPPYVWVPTPWTRCSDTRIRVRGSSRRPRPRSRRASCSRGPPADDDPHLLPPRRALRPSRHDHLRGGHHRRDHLHLV